MDSTHRRRAPRRFCIVCWQAGGLIAWFWGVNLRWGPSEHAVFFLREEDAARERLQIKSYASHGDLQTPEVVEVSRFNKKYGKNIVPASELVK